MEIEAKPYLLENCIQNYQWGSEGEQAFIPVLLNSSADIGVKYAELWVGSHPKAPSCIMDNGRSYSLLELIEQYPTEILGEEVFQKFGKQIPFLFKLLSAAEPLSIQVHPNKQQAALLNKKDPENYPDDNHKPEIAVALDSLTALVGIKNLTDLKDTFSRYPDLAELVGDETVHELMQAGEITDKSELSRKIFAGIFNTNRFEPEKLSGIIAIIKAKLISSTESLDDTEKLFIEMTEKYPGDIGLIFILLMNMVTLHEGEGLYLNAGQPHAYIKGNIVECMANSDNVIRAGLTPKFKDADALLDVMRYDIELSVLRAGQNEKNVVYGCTVDEFRLSRITLNEHEELSFSTDNKMEIIAVISGEIGLNWPAGKEHYKKGEFILIPALIEEYKITCNTDGLIIFRVEIP